MSSSKLLARFTNIIAKMYSGNANGYEIAEVIVRNQQLLYKKLDGLVSWVEMQTPPAKADRAATTLAVVDDLRCTNEKIVAQQKQLAEENALLKKDVADLVKKITELEVEVNGKESGASLKLLAQVNELAAPKVEEQKNNNQAAPPTPAQQSKATVAEKNAEQGSSKKGKKEAKAEKNKDAQGAKENKPKPQEGKQQPKAAAAPAAVEQPLTVARLDLRIGKIVDVKKHPDADSLYVEQIDCGEEKPRTVVSGLVKFVPIEEMKDRLVVVLCNLKPAKMRGVTSEAMVMCASTPEKVEVLTPPPGSVPGDRVTFKTYPGEPDAQLNPKKKIWEQIAPDLGTNADLVAAYKGDPFVVEGKGVVKAQTLKNVIVK